MRWTPLLCLLACADVEPPSPYAPYSLVPGRITTDQEYEANGARIVRESELPDIDPPMVVHALKESTAYEATTLTCSATATDSSVGRNTTGSPRIPSITSNDPASRT